MNHATQNDIFLKLAELLADSKGRLSKESFDVLITIGAVMYKDGLVQFNARADVALVMDKSAQGKKRLP